MIRASFVAGALLLSLSGEALQSEGTSRTVFPRELKNRKFDENADITDAKLKADTGSLSRYSLKFNMTYNGPTLSNLSEKDQPNPDGTVGSFQTAVGGGMGARYRFNSRSSMGLATGIKMIHPFHGMERFDLSNPSVTYDYASRLGSLQMRNSPGFILRTVPEFLKVGQTGYILDTHSLVYELGLSGFSIGVDMAGAYFLYNREYEAKDGKAARYSLELNPNMKYNFSEKFSFVTAAGLAWWNPRSRTDSTTLERKTLSQKVGLGYAVKRDLYLNPYLAFFPERLSFSTVSFNFAAIFSAF